MIRVPIPSDRWLPPLGVTLLVLAAVVSLPWLQGDTTLGGRLPPDPAPYYLSAGLLALVALAVLLSPRSTSLPFLGIVVGGIVQTLYFWSIYRGFSNYTSLLAQLPSSLLISSATPFLWGTAIAEREHPEDKRTRRAAKTAARVILVGFAFVFLCEALPYFFLAGKMGGFYSGTSAITILYSLLRVGARILLFWSVVETLRKAKDVETVRTRAIRVHALLCGWLALGAAISLVTLCRTLFSKEPTYFGRASLWHGAVFLALTLTITCLAVRRYRPPGSAA